MAKKRACKKSSGKELGKFAAELARKSIRHFLETQEIMKIGEKGIPFAELKESKGCFVTLTINRELRGCIGNIEPHGKVYEAIIRNAVLAAFRDDRFNPLSQEEFSIIKIEISVLTTPTKLEFSSPDDLISKLGHEMGVIIAKGGRGATFLPQVWEDIPEKEEFLSQLCMKAGLGPDEWKKPGLKVETYRVEAYTE
ncbi:Uncharacterised protein [uncultured archaeon]|nr:Uncharacterised protein [uncultured archaeon]